jgi:hypothetical protein
MNKNKIFYYDYLYAVYVAISSAWIVKAKFITMAKLKRIFSKPHNEETPYLSLNSYRTLCQRAQSRVVPL